MNKVWLWFCGVGQMFPLIFSTIPIRRVWRYQRGYQNP